MKYIAGLMVGVLSGKAGNTVASRGRFGTYIKTRAMPTNPNTSAQQSVRDTLAAAALQWASLTPTERTSWDTYAGTLTKTNPLGATYVPTGFNEFVGNASNLAIYNGFNSGNPATPIGAAPASIATATLTYVGGTSGSLAYTATPLPASTKLVIECTGPMSPGRKFIRNSDYRQIFITAAAAASPANIFSAWEARYGDSTNYVGKVINFRVYTLNDQGLRSAYTSGFATIS